MKNNIQTTVRIDGEKYKKLRLKLLKAGKTFTDWVQEAIDSYLESFK